jgi:hypothetical protein
MKTISRLFKICMAGMALASVDISAATSWVQGTSGTSSFVSSPYNSSSGNNHWSWTNSGTLTASKTTTRLQAVAANFFGRADATTGSNGGFSSNSESGYAQAYSWWNWTGAPGAASAVSIRAVQSLAKDPNVNYGIISTVLSVAPSAGTSAGGYSFTSIYGDADSYDGSAYIAQDHSEVFAEAEGSEVANFRTYAYDLGGANVTLSNSHLEDIGDFTRVYSDYSVSIDHSYNTATGLSLLFGSATISYDIDCEAYSNGTPPFMGVSPTAVAYGRISINGNVTMDFTF